MGDSSSLTIVAYPWLAMGHLTPFLQLSNKLAGKGHKVFFLLPKSVQAKLEKFNHHPEFLKFITISIPQVEGLPPGAETSLDVPLSLQNLLATAMDLTRPTVESFLQETKPHLVFFDFQHWMPAVAGALGIKSVQFWIFRAATLAYISRKELSHFSELLEPLPGFPTSSVKLSNYEARGLFEALMGNVEDKKKVISMFVRLTMGSAECDAFACRACREMDGPYIDFLKNFIQYQRPLLLAGPILPERPIESLDENWANWLNGFPSRNVIFCAFGSECILQIDQFQELLLGFELTGLPFFAALRTPLEANTLEAALPEGFKERTRGRGIVYGGWAQQQLILTHPSMGCFVSHSGVESLFEALAFSDCEFVLLPYRVDQFINARVIAEELKIGVEVKKGEDDGLFTKEGVCKAIKLVMDDGSETGKEIRANRIKWKEFLLGEGLKNTYIDGFVDQLQELVN